MKLSIIDFSDKIGTVVCRSEHFQREHCKKGKPQVGIITDHKHFADSMGNPICWPQVMWEGDCMPRTTHPVLVDLYRKNQKKYAKYRDMVE